MKTPPAATRWGVAAIAAAIALAAIAGCGASSNNKPAAKNDPNATLLVWTDSTRQPGFEQFQKLHPEIKMKIETYDSSALLTKIRLFNRTGKGWPDVIFGMESGAVSLSTNAVDYAQSLNDRVPADVQAKFGNTNAGCTVDGKLYCLKNDIAQTVLWYDEPLMKKFGYTVPTTWAEYADLGQKVAKEHPGYIVGSAGFQYIYNDFFWPSGCPLQTVTEPMTVHIDVKDAKCSRVSDMLDPLIAAGSVARGGPFDPEVVKLGQQGKILMMPGASWYGDFVFKPDTGFHVPAGHIAAAAYPKWDGADKNWSGATGGGVYFVSKHSANLKGAVEIAQWMATSNDYQVGAPTFPAYGPAAEAWGAKHADDPFYAENPVPVMIAQAALINPAENTTAFDVWDAFTATVVSGVRSGGKVADGMPALQTQLSQIAQTAGYVVK